MQEEINQKTVALVIRAAKLDADILGKAMRMYLGHRKDAASKKHGKLTVRKLMGKDQGAASMEVRATNIRTFERAARKYNVDFAVRKEKGSSPPKYTVFFKARDQDVIAAAFKEFVEWNEKKHSRPSFKERLLHFKEKAAGMDQDNQKERAKEKSRDREPEL